MQAADRLSFLETNIDLFLGFVRSGRFSVGRRANEVPRILSTHPGARGQERSHCRSTSMRPRGSKRWSRCRPARPLTDGSSTRPPNRSHPCSRFGTSARGVSLTRLACWRSTAGRPRPCGRHRPARPAAARSRPAFRRPRRQGTPGTAKRRDRRRSGAAHRSVSGDDGCHRGSPRAPALSGAGRGRQRRRLRADQESRDARRKHLQRLAGSRHCARAARVWGAREPDRTLWRAADPA